MDGVRRAAGRAPRGARCSRSRSAAGSAGAGPRRRRRVPSRDRPTLRGSPTTSAAATNAPGAIVAVQRGQPRAGDRGAPGPGTGAAADRSQADDPFVVASVSKAFTAARRARARAPRSSWRSTTRWRSTSRAGTGASRSASCWTTRAGSRPGATRTTRRTRRATTLESADLSRRFTMAESLEPVRAMPLLARPGTEDPLLEREHDARRPGRRGGDRQVARRRVPPRTCSTRCACAAPATAPQETPPRPPIPGVLVRRRRPDRARHVAVPAGLVPDARRPVGRRWSPTRPTCSGSRRRSSAATSRPAGSPAQARADQRGRRRARDHRLRPGRATASSTAARAARQFRRIGFAGNGPGVAVRVVYDPTRDVTVLVFANSSERGKLDPFVLRLFDRVQ